MSTPFSFSGSLNFPPDAGQQAIAIAMAMSGVVDSTEPGVVLKLTGSGTRVLDLGTLPAAGLKGLLIKLDAAVGAVPIKVQFNGGGAPGASEISPGGFLAIGSPNPVAGITAISIVFTADSTVRVWVLG